MSLELGEAERIAIAYAPARLRSAHGALLGLDGALRRVALSAREPLSAQLKLAWWRDACAGLPQAQGHPILTALAASWRGGAEPLVALVDAWEEVAVADGNFPAAAEAVARARGAMFAMGGGAGEDAHMGREAARLWTLVTLADHAPDPAQRAEMRAAVCAISPGPLPRALRPLAVLGGLARRALAAERSQLVGDRWSPFAAMRLGIFGR